MPSASHQDEPPIFGSITRDCDVMTSLATQWVNDHKQPLLRRFRCTERFLFDVFRWPYQLVHTICWRNTKKADSTRSAIYCVIPVDSSKLSTNRLVLCLSPAHPCSGMSVLSASKTKPNRKLVKCLKKICRTCNLRSPHESNGAMEIDKQSFVFHVSRRAHCEGGLKKFPCAQ